MADIADSANGNFTMDQDRNIRFVGATPPPGSRLIDLDDELRQLIVSQGVMAGGSEFVFAGWSIFVPNSGFISMSTEPLEPNVFNAVYQFLQMTISDNRYRLSPVFKYRYPTP